MCGRCNFRKHEMSKPNFSLINQIFIDTTNKGADPVPEAPT